ncbi:SDR family NAD(P)-dependent oxidoreductase [Agrobacterium sp.]|uniref:SDR family oxidoreductase n=1 Tax=Agrobacterium sp. TaxID=361 RepID=UPI0028A8A2BD|nr:SDR family NAD(P)-dependent oxidoreductase [Agrobacterium sp.]
MKLTGNTIFITGGTSGIGRGLAEALHKLGNKVIISGRRKALLDEVTAANPGMAAIPLDVTSIDSIQAAAAQLVTTYPELNVVFNNAGFMPFDDVSGPVDDVVAQDLITTNLLGPIRVTSALIEHLKTRPEATILYTSSVLAFVPIASNAIYSATKAALHSFALSQRFQLRNTTVRVQEIAPPWVDTDLIYKSGDPRAMPLAAFVEQTLAALGTDAPEVIVDAIRPMRDNPGADEHALFNAFNQSIVDNPIPVGA